MARTTRTRASARNAAPNRNPLPFPPRRTFASLSVRDLLDAREAYHVHLTGTKNVVGTAIGRYLIHKDDWYAKNPPEMRRPKDFPRIEQPRTLQNGVVKAWSWPCVLVFVREWIRPHRAGADEIPKRLYLPDGRVVPTCVVLAPPDETPPRLVDEPGVRASSLLGGSYPCLRSAQGVQVVGTVGCIVQRGGVTFALTNRHVAGMPGDVVEASVRGESVEIGVAADAAVGKVPMSTVFPEWPGLSALVNVDAALVTLRDASRWTAQVFGIGEIGELYDATAASVTLDLIGLPLRAFGGVSGVLEGEIKALFCRYDTIAGNDHVADLVIGPRPDRKAQADPRKPAFRGNETRPGDSGAIWFYDPPTESVPREDDDVFGADQPPDRGERARRLRPVTMQWGGAPIVLPDGTRSALALGTFLSTICRGLDVDIVRGYGTGHAEYWGKLAHFAVGWKACDLLGDGVLADLMKANQRNIGFGDKKLSEGSAFSVGAGEFVPLADVPDYVWMFPRGQTEVQQHFSDIDYKAIDGGPSLLERYDANPAGTMSARIWRDYFQGYKDAGVGPGEGSLPFRIWQIWDEMVAFLAKNKVDRFVAAAGILAHYVGDASMPLHTSWLHHGRPELVPTPNGEYPPLPDSPGDKKHRATPAAKIHAIYDERVLEIATGDAMREINALLPGRAARETAIKNGRDAAIAALDLMKRSRETLSPEKILEKDDPDLRPQERARKLWNDPAVRKAIVGSVAESTRLLARLWQDAWQAAVKAGFDPKSVDPRAFTEARLTRICKDPAFLPSMTLGEMADSGRF